jgi:benzoyl-CoA reductase/2-hydroxyglutaryl-CoA dehydratase subunit BcrC/BadD/HgdB
MPAGLLPVPIIEIVELKLRLSPIPVFRLLEEIDIDGFLTNSRSICGKFAVSSDVIARRIKSERLRV